MRESALKLGEINVQLIVDANINLFVTLWVKTTRWHPELYESASCTNLCAVTLDHRTECPMMGENFSECLQSSMLENKKQLPRWCHSCRFYQKYKQNKHCIELKGRHLVNTDDICFFPLLTTVELTLLIYLVDTGQKIYTPNGVSLPLDYFVSSLVMSFR